MIHSSTLKELTEDELALLWAIAEHFFNKMGMNCRYQWLKMVKVNVLEHVLNNSNIKEEYFELKNSLLTKLKQGVY